MSLSKFFYQLPKYYLKSPVLNNTHIIRANKIIKIKECSSILVAHFIRSH